MCAADAPEDAPWTSSSGTMRHAPPRATRWSGGGRAGTGAVRADYVKTPPSRAEIKAALRAMGLKPRALLRRRGTRYEALGLDQAGSDAGLIAAMAEHPLLIERPVVRTP